MPKTIVLFVHLKHLELVLLLQSVLLVTFSRKKDATPQM
jgi:hypothetical protein